MPQIINTNINALTIQGNLNASQGSLAESLQRLSSGLRINSAKDDAAGLAISARMTSQIGGLDQAGRNANDAISLSQTADGGLAGVADNLNTIRSLAIQSANFTNSASDRAALQAEALQLTNEIQRVATTTQFNGSNILDGTLSNAQFQIGANAGQTVTFSINNAQTTAIGNNGFQAQTNTSGATVAATAVATVPANNRINVGTYSLIVNGNTATFSTLAGQSVSSIAADLNLLSGTTGVTALAQTAAGLSFSATGTVGFTLGAGGNASAVVSAALTSLTDVSALANAINSQSSVTGIFASSIPGFGTLTLTNSQGADIQVSNFIEAGGSASLTGSNAYTGAVTGATQTLIGSAASVNSSTVGGELQLNSANIYSLQSNATATSAGLVTTSASQFSTLSALSTVNIGTVSGANAAIAIIDAALSNINTIRGGLGALQNRFSSTISNLQTASQNLSASRSRIQDADFASETTNLSRSQVLQQAGTAMLAQANQLPAQVLTLLR